MAIVTWNPFSEIETMRHQMHRLFDDMTSDFNNPGPNLWKPPIELFELENRLVLKAILPGIEAKDINVNVTRDTVSINGEYRNDNQNQNSGIFYTEFRQGKFERLINLPVSIQNDKVQAEYTHGILTLNLPKTETSKNTVIRVNISSGDNKEAQKIAASAE